MISPQDVRYFLEIVRCDGVRKASERLGMTPPAMTHAVRRLELSLGYSLFQSKGRSLVLTSSGKRFWQQAEAELSRWESWPKQIDSTAEDVAGTLKIGVHSSVAQYLLPQLLPNFLGLFPRVQIELQHDLSRKVMTRVLEKEVDCGFVVNPTNHPQLIMRPILQDEVGFWWSGKGESCLILDPQLAQSQWLLRKIKRKNSFDQYIHSGNLDVISKIVASGQGVGILPGRVARMHGLRPYKGLEYQFRDHLKMVYLPSFRSSPIGLAWSQYVQNTDLAL